MASAYRVRVVINGTGGDQEVATHYMDQILSVTAQQAVQNVMTFWTAIRTNMAAPLNIESESDVPLFTAPDTLATVTSTTPVVTNGTSGGEWLPPMTQALIAWPTSAIVGNRRVLGHTFVPNMTEVGNLPSGVPNGTMLTNIRTAGLALSAAGLVIASRKGNIFAPTTGCVLRSQWSVLRSRR